MDTTELPNPEVIEAISSISAKQARITTELARVMTPKHMQSVYTYIDSRATDGYDYIYPKELELVLKLSGSNVRVKNILNAILATLKTDGYKVSKTKISW
jgi:hypothetical protein